MKMQGLCMRTRLSPSASGKGVSTPEMARLMISYYHLSTDISISVEFLIIPRPRLG